MYFSHTCACTYVIKSMNCLLLSFTFTIIFPMKLSSKEFIFFPEDFIARIVSTHLYIIMVKKKKFPFLFSEKFYLL